MKISVLTPSYNSAKYLERAIQSVLVQSYTHWEHIVVDGGSSDGTKEILAKYPDLIWISESDKGQSDAMNKAFKQSSGDIIVYLNADDKFAAGTFQTVIDFLTAHPECDMVVGDLEVVNCSQGGCAHIAEPFIELEKIYQFYNYYFPLNPVSYFYKRKVQEKIGEFPLENHYSMDYYFLLRAFLTFKIMKVNKIFGTYYHDGQNKSSNFPRASQTLKQTIIQFVLEQNSEAISRVFEIYLDDYLCLRDEHGKLLQEYNDLKDKQIKLWQQYSLAITSKIRRVRNFLSQMYKKINLKSSR